MSRLMQLCVTSSILITALVLWSPGIPSAANDPVVPYAVRLALLSIDFSDIVSSCDKYYIGDSQYLGQWQPTDILAKNLTPNEQLMLSTLISKDGQIRISPAYSAMYVRAFRDIHGTMPRDGVDLMLMIAPRYLSQAGWKKFSTLTKAQQAKYASIAINPATGRFYDSFTKPGWSSYSIRVNKKQGEGSTDKWLVPIYHKETKSESYEMRKVQAWEYTVYGGKKNRIILRATSWQTLGEGGEPPKPVKGCGCGSKK
jgi:hypothetical protein